MIALSGPQKHITKDSDAFHNHFTQLTMFLWTESKSRSITRKKKKTGKYEAILTEQAWPINDLLYSPKKENF